MSKTIKITIVIDDEKSNTESAYELNPTVVVTHDSSMTLMSTLLQNHLISGSFCGGRGDCGRCRVQFIKGAVLPTALERSVMEPEELRQGYRLACLARPKDDCVIRLALIEAAQIDIVSEMMDVTDNIDHISQHSDIAEYSKADVMELKKCETGLIAVDLGTTTIAMQLMDLKDGQVLDSYCEMNPQRRYGADVLSRIKASVEGNREELRRLVLEVLERGTARFEKYASMHGMSVCGMCIAGNTTMEHLLMGYDVSALGCSPFTPVEIGLQEYHHPAWGFRVWLAPGISAFVGGDITAGLYALNMLSARGLQNADGATLLIDLGTNGEMAVTDGSRIIVTATAAGPAFEGGAGAGIVGSDMIACAASLLHNGILDETGLLAEPYFTEGIRVGSPAVMLRSQDIRDLQMAKAAVRAGVEILWKRIGAPEIKRVYLAGGFGYYLDVDSAFDIGLLPESMRGRVQAVGNSSLAGAFRMGRDLCQCRIDRESLQQSLSLVESVNLAEQEGFDRLYVQHMNFAQESVRVHHK